MKKKRESQKKVFSGQNRDSKEHARHKNGRDELFAVRRNDWPKNACMGYGDPSWILLGVLSLG